MISLLRKPGLKVMPPLAFNRGGIFLLITK